MGKEGLTNNANVWGKDESNLRCRRRLRKLVGGADGGGRRWIVHAVESVLEEGREMARGEYGKKVYRTIDAKV